MNSTVKWEYGGPVLAEALEHPTDAHWEYGGPEWVFECVLIQGIYQLGMSLTPEM